MHQNLDCKQNRNDFIIMFWYFILNKIQIQNTCSNKTFGYMHLSHIYCHEFDRFFSHWRWWIYWDHTEGFKCKLIVQNCMFIIKVIWNGFNTKQIFSFGFSIHTIETKFYWYISVEKFNCIKMQNIFFSRSFEKWKKKTQHHRIWNICELS